MYARALFALMMVPGCDGVFGLDGRFPPDAGATADASMCTPRGNPMACSTDGLTCNGPAQVVTCNNSCWVTCIETLRQTIAAARCTLWGGSLAPLQTAADHACLVTMLFPDRATWIGLEQDGNPSLIDVGWSWNSDHCELGYLNWSPGQPNDGDLLETAKENCAYAETMTAAQGKWHDFPCDATFSAFACRRN